MNVLERALFPRIADVANSAQEMAEKIPMNVALQTSDSLYTMVLHPSERCNDIVKDDAG